MRRLLASLTLALVLGCQSSGPSETAPEPAPAPEPSPAPAAPEPAPPATVTVTARTLTVRDAPSGKGAKTATLRKGQQAPVLEERTGWLRLGLPGGGSGWVDARYTSRKPACLPDRPFGVAGEPVLVIDPTGPRGRVVVEADVDESGVVRSTKVLSNSGAPELGPKAEAELKRMRFTAPVKDCRPRRFLYTYTRTY